jgi:hypothetical protein
MLSLLRPKRNKKTCKTEKETESEPNKQQAKKHWKMRKHYITESYGGFYGNT